MKTTINEVLLQNFFDYNFPPHISVWSLVFVQDQEQFVSIGNTNSTVLKSNAGTPHGIIAEQNDFKLLIKCFTILFDINSVKHVDDITMSSI